jgi:hypothetical protein
LKSPAQDVFCAEAAKKVEEAKVNPFAVPVCNLCSTLERERALISRKTPP